MIPLDHSAEHVDVAVDCLVEAAHVFHAQSKLLNVLEELLAGR